MHTQFAKRTLGLGQKLLRHGRCQLQIARGVGGVDEYVHSDYAPAGGVGRGECVGFVRAD